MNRVIFITLCILASLLGSGCTSISYKPALSLGESQSSVQAKIQMNQLKDMSPPGDRETKAFGISATEPSTLAGDLSTEVTNAILTDFSNNQVFQTIQKRMEKPDLILNGTIHRFYGKAGINALGWVTLPVDIIWLFGLPIQDQYGAVDIEISIQTPKGSLVGTYRGKSEFSDNFSMYTNVMLATGTRLNKAFDDALRQIRSQILADKHKLEARMDN